LKDPFAFLPGPSPWYCLRNRQFTLGDHSYEWHDWQSYPPLAGCIYLKPEDKTPILLLDFQCYFKPRSDGICLIWHDDFDRNALEFHLLNLSELMPIYNAKEIAVNARKDKKSIVYSSESALKLQISTASIDGQFDISCHDDFSSFGEILTLVDAGVSIPSVHASLKRAIYAVDFEKLKVTVYPQDWFNNGSYDFGYQWISRVTRDETGRIIGDGVRIDSFRLNEDGRTLQRWGV
jgi:hypothetical protein